MSVSIITPYRTHIEECEACLAEILSCLEATSPDELCHRCLRENANMLKMTITLMRKKSPMAARFLVDCAEACADCARCCSRYNNAHARRCAAVCEACVVCCRLGSGIDV